MSATGAPRLRRRHPRRIRQDRRRACARRRTTSSGCRSRRRAAMRSKLDWSGYYAAEAELPRHPRVRRLSDRRAGRLHRLVAVLPDLGAGRKLPGDPRRCQGRRRGARALYDDAQAMLKQIVDETLVHAPAPWSASGRPMPTATTSWCMPTRRAAKPIATLHTLRQQLARREGRANVALADFVAPRAAACRLHRRLRGHRRHRRGRGRRPLQARQRRLLRHHGQGAGRPAGRSLRRAPAPDACARNSGAMRPTKH